MFRHEFPEQLVFNCEQVKVMMRHIGGSPPNYNPETRKELVKHQPIMNPGTAGKTGWHKIRTIIRFTNDGSDIKNCEVIELGKK